MLCSAVQLYTNEYARFLFRLPSRMYTCMHGWDLVVVLLLLPPIIVVVVFVFIERKEFKKNKGRERGRLAR